MSDHTLTAACKDDAGKLRFDLIPVVPLEELARVYTLGAVKYADRNWEKGLDYSRVYGALQRHATAWWKGERDHEVVPGQRAHHLASVAWCALALMEYERTHPERDDRVKVHPLGCNELPIGRPPQAVRCQRFCDPLPDGFRWETDGNGTLYRVNGNLAWFLEGLLDGGWREAEGVQRRAHGKGFSVYEVSHAFKHLCTLETLYGVTYVAFGKGRELH